MKEPLNELLSARTATSKANPVIINPKIYHLINKYEEEQFQSLLANNTSIVLHDEITSQLEEFIRIKNVSKKLNEVELHKLISAHLNNIPLYKYGVWVYYPWLNKAVHILDEEEFIEVRTNRNKHKITSTELSVLRSKKIGIIGLSVGQCIASTLILERCCSEIRLADFDDIQLSNLNRIYTGLYNLGVLKITQIARNIAELDPFIKVVCYTEGITENNIENFLCNNGKLDLLIEECDSIDIKILARIKSKQFNIPVVMETNDRGMIDIERYDLDSDYPLLHGLLGNISFENFKNLTLEESLPIFLKFFSFHNVSARGKVTLVELGQTVFTWPQIASSVVLGGAVVTDVSRRILLDQLKISGRYYVDIENIIKEDISPFYKPPNLEELNINEIYKIANDINFKQDDDDVSPSISVIKSIITDAGTAPSSGNDQPWKFLFKNNKLYLFHELFRSYSFGDYRNMASYISLGTALENIVLSSHHLGYEIAIELFPDKNNLKCVAVIRFKSKANALTEKHDFDDLFNFIQQRCTNRKIIPNEPASLNVLDELKAVTESIEGAKISFLTDKNDLQVLGSIISACDRIRIMNPQAHYEFFNREIRWSAQETEEKRTGMDVATLELTAPAMLALKTISDNNVMQVLRDINGLEAYKEVSVPNAVNSAAMGLVTMPEYNSVNFVKGGRAVQRQWLKSTQLGFAYHPMLIPLYLFPRIIYGNGEGLNANIISELKELRKKFMQLFPGDEKRGEVFLFRIFKGGEIEKRSLRLPLSKILQIEANTKE